MSPKCPYHWDPHLHRIILGRVTKASTAPAAMANDNAPSISCYQVFMIDVMPHSFTHVGFRDARTKYTYTLLQARPNLPLHGPHDKARSIVLSFSRNVPGMLPLSIAACNALNQPDPPRCQFHLCPRPPCLSLVLSRTTVVSLRGY